MLEECYPKEQSFPIVCNLSLLNTLCIKTKKVVSSGKRNSDVTDHLK